MTEDQTTEDQTVCSFGAPSDCRLLRLIAEIDLADLEGTRERLPALKKRWL